MFKGSNPGERWRSIPSAPRYKASSQGRIYSPASHQILTGWLCGNGYRYVDVRHLDGLVQRRSVHSLVCEAFRGSRPDGQEVRHLDGNPLNNAAANLRWGTPSQNRHDSVRHGTHRMAGGRPTMVS